MKTILHLIIKHYDLDVVKAHVYFGLKEMAYMMAMRNHISESQKRLFYDFLDENKEYKESKLLQSLYLSSLRNKIIAINFLKEAIKKIDKTPKIKTQSRKK